MRPEGWVVHPQLQQQLIEARPPAIQQATDRLMAAVGDVLLAIGIGQRVQEGGLPIGGLQAAVESAIVYALIFVITNEDPRYANRVKISEPLNQQLLVAQLDPRVAARIAQEAQRREDPKRG